MGTFWLKVQENYVIENFDALVKYLRNYQAPADDSVDSDFEDTFKCLHKVALEKCDKARRGSNLFEEYRGDDVVDLTKLVKLATASVLTSYHIRNENDYEMMIALANVLVLNQTGNKDAATYLKFLHFITACIERRPLTELGLNWGSLDQSIEVLTQHLLDTQWNADAENVINFYEQNGLALINRGQLTVSTVNHELYEPHRMKSVITIPEAIDIQSPVADKLKASASTLEVMEKMNELLTELSQFRGTAPKYKGEYQQGDLVPVEITDKGNSIISARTIDPRIKTIKGRVMLKDYKMNEFTILPQDEIYDLLQVGDQIVVEYVKMTQGQFELGKKVYNTFYRDEAERLCDEDAEAQAMFLCTYPGGYRWLTIDGMVVNVLESDPDITEEDRYHIDMIDAGEGTENFYTIHLRYKNIYQLKTSGYGINGKVCTPSMVRKDDDVADRSEFMRRAKEYLLDEFHNYCETEADDVPQLDNIKRLKDPLGFVIAYRSLFFMSHSLDTTMDRIKTLACAILLANCCGDEAKLDKEYMLHEMKYLECGIRFVRGDNPEELKLTHVDSLEGVANVVFQEHLVNVLSTYQQDTGLSTLARPHQDDIDEMEKLVKASNILRGMIHPKSFARIKEEIASRLELSDEYIPEAAGNKEENLTYYGVESDTLEFKSSIVFPPCNRRTSIGIEDPENQKWAIIKTVCGFLNSATGGDLYLGVKDNGYAKGVKDDIEALFKRGRISQPNIDAYRNYVSMMLDQSLKCYKEKKISGMDITNETVSFDIVTDNDLELLHIRVLPFSKDAVALKDRPDFVKRAYIRKSGATKPLEDIEALSDERRRNSAQR
jgi:hypothetical protein